ncbi:PREDICTED: protoheme IX farnesyltransferase, mitochondrial-like [Gekko japonicus]|uniref:Protoheme IX farnesyltransferase, mitochondrial-like n=1 Tax=Gekko japonicus TaxID=146911 RepID=A0ABM1KXA4_GEKJA|nr:PREDICTED: protoheme IX farnesyltransferase, mitochondrial-like [Gekko japonicus]
MGLYANGFVPTMDPALLVGPHQPTGVSRLPPCCSRSNHPWDCPRGTLLSSLPFFYKYISQNNKRLQQQAKLKAESAASPFPERELLASEKMAIRDVSPLLPPSSEKPVINEGLELTAVTGDLETVAETSSKKEKQWKEMKLNMNELPGILARLSKIKLTGIIVVF